MPTAAAELSTIESASMAVVTFAFRAGDVVGLDGSSGFLVPPIDGRAIKASTFSFVKWEWVRSAGAATGLVHLRTSLGRHHEEAVLQRPDEELVALSLADLADAVGLSARPVDTHVQRWGGGLPQYAVGHLDRVARIRAALAEVPGLAVCGAAYDGVGIPAVIASARRAVADL
jgi:oxygen-dependent protoporphyrinogen oxidase